MILHELQGKETARHKGGRGGKKELTGGESSDELTRTKTEQIEDEEGVEGMLIADRQQPSHEVRVRTEDLQPASARVVEVRRRRQ